MKADRNGLLAVWYLSLGSSYEEISFIKRAPTKLNWA